MMFCDKFFLSEIGFWFGRLCISRDKVDFFSQDSHRQTAGIIIAVLAGDSDQRIPIDLCLCLTCQKLRFKVLRLQINVLGSLGICLAQKG